MPSAAPLVTGECEGVGVSESAHATLELASPVMELPAMELPAMGLPALALATPARAAGATVRQCGSAAVQQGGAAQTLPAGRSTKRQPIPSARSAAPHDNRVACGVGWLRVRAEDVKVDY